MRLYEATGVGSLLLTDEGANLSELFEPGREVVTYADVDDLVEKARHYLAHDEERRAIASAGQARTLRDHTYAAPHGGAGGDPREPQAVIRPDLADAFAGKRVLITGGLGFIGSNLARELVELGARGHARRLADRPSTAAACYNVAGIEDRRARSTSPTCATSTASATSSADQDVLFNLAGQTSHLDSMTDPYTDLEINCRSQLSILEACRTRTRTSRIVFASTRQIYGRPQYLPVDESHPIVPVDVNGINKTAGEWYHLLYGDVYGIRASRAAADEHLRAADAREGRAPDVPRLLAPAGSSRRARSSVFGDGAQRRDFNYVDDAVARVPARRRRATRPTGRSTTSAATRTCPCASSPSCSSSRRRRRVRLVPFPDDRKAIDIGDFYADYSTIERELGWAPGRRLRGRARADARVLPRARRRTTGATSEGPVPRPRARDGVAARRARRGDRARARQRPVHPRDEVGAASRRRSRRTAARAHAVGVASGTDAITIALRALGVGPGDEVITAPNTCVPTIVGIERAGATPVLADVDPATLHARPARRRAPR